jgi:hypothetical protein
MTLHTEFGLVSKQAAINARLDAVDRTLREMEARGEVNERYDEIEDEFVSLCIALHELDATE